MDATNLGQRSLTSLLVFAASGVATMALLVACSSNGSQSLPSPPAVAAPTATVPIAASLDSLGLPPLTCLDPKLCPSPIGELVLSTSKGPRFCTVSLVAPDLVLTAAHCAPPAELLGPGNVVTGGCWIRWAEGSASASSPSIAACAEVIDITPIGVAPGAEARLDHAFIRLAAPQTGRRILSLPTASDHALDDQIARSRGTGVAQLTLFGTAIGAGGHVIQALQCSLDGTATIPEMKTDPKQDIVMPNCPVERGFSGGPIIDDKHLVGVVSFQHHEPNDASVTAVGTRVRRLPEVRRR